jgi:hypothetical protein
MRYPSPGPLARATLSRWERDFCPNASSNYFALTICEPPGYHFRIMTGRCSILVFLKQSFAGRVSPFNLPDRSAGWHRAE